MCDPLTIAGIALTGASTVANSIAQSKVAKAREGAMAAERTRQMGLDREADALNAQSQNRYQDFEGQQEDRSGELTDYFEGQAMPVDEVNTAAALPPSSSNITVAEEGRQRQKARAYTDQQAASLGQLRSFGDLVGSIGRDQARDAMSIGQIGGFKRGSSSILPYEMEAANSKGAGFQMLGDVLGGIGGVATSAGLNGGSIFGVGGATPKVVSGAAPAAAKTAARVDPWSKLRTPTSLGSLYGGSLMPIVANRFYNDPALGQAFSNLAAAFAPPSGSDAAGWAAANAKNAEAKRLADFYRIMTDPASSQAVKDAYGIGAGAFLPSQGYELTTREQDLASADRRYGADQSLAGTRYGADRSYAASTENNVRDNERALQTSAMDNQRQTITSLYGPLNQGQVRPAVPAEIAGTMGLPGIDAAQGLPKPLSETEQKAIERQGLIDGGLLTDQMLLDTIVGGDTPVQAVGPSGAPVFMSPGEAVRTAAEPFVKTGAEAKPTNALAVLPNGQRVPARQAPDGSWVHAQTGQRLPDEIQVFDTPKPQGSAADVGLGTAPMNNIEQQLIDTTIARNTAVSLRDLVAKSPASQGMVGALRGTAQNLLQAGGEVGAYFGGQAAEVMKDIEAGAADANLAGRFDPNIPAIEMLANLLAFQYAKTTTGERLSNEMLEQSRRALGLDRLTGNQADTLARLDQAITQIDQQANILNGIRTNGLGGAPAAAAPTGAPAAPAPSPESPQAPAPRRLRYNPETGTLE